MSSAIIYVQPGQDEQINEVAEQLKELLGNKGVHFYYNSEDKYIGIGISEETAKEKLKRNAGRRRKLSQYKISDIRAMQEQGKSKNEILVETGIPRATFYRKWKRMEEYQGEFDLYF